jgi:hypothetical protein
MNTKPIFYDRKKSAEYVRQRGLPITPGTLQKLACVGGGPRYSLFGNKAVYAGADLDAWIDERLGTPRSTARGAK